VILLRSSPYGNGIFTYLDEQKAVIQKSTYCKAASEVLSREHQGYQWYFQRSGHQVLDQLSFRQTAGQSYTRLRIPYLPGKSPNYNLSLSQNFSILKLAIEHYFEIWPAPDAKLFPLHGDFSVGNLLIQENQIAIIDWEHFQMTGAPYGFDLANLIYESAYFSFGGGGSLKENDRRQFIALKRLIKEKYRSFGLKETQNFISAHSHFWGPLIHKLPVMKFSPQQVSYMENLDLIN
jgi:hypothetical protein